MPNESSNRPVVLPLSLRRRPVDYLIQHPMAKLRTKYLSGRDASFASVDFDLFVAQRALLQNRIDGADLYATLLMNSSVKHVDVRNVMASIRETEKALAAIPEVPLRTADLGELEQPIRRLLRALMCRGFGIAKTFKLLSLKRPALFPMIDGLVLTALYDVNSRNIAASSPAAVDLAFDALSRFRTVLIDTRNDHLPVLAAKLSSAVGSDLRRARVPEPHPRFTETRILDNLIWFDWGGYVNFRSAWRATRTAVLPRA